LLEDPAVLLHAEALLAMSRINGRVPTVWLKDVATFEYGYTATATDDGDVRYVRITDIDEFGQLRRNDSKFIILNDDAKSYLLNNGDVLVARIGATAGKTLFFNSAEPAIFASYLIRIRFDPEKVLPQFYWCFAQSEQY
jgi:hypothetical protein